MRLTESQQIKIFKEYKIYELLYNEHFSEQIYEANFLNTLLAGTESDTAVIKANIVKLRPIVAELLVKVAKVGGRMLINSLVATTKKVYQISRSEDKAVRYLFYGLVSLVVMYGGIKIIDSYNNNPVFDNTHMESVTVNGKNTVQVTDAAKNTTITPVYNSQSNTFEFQDSSRSEKVFDAPIVPLKKGVKKKDYYKASTYMQNALMEVENFRPRIYDAKHPDRKITQKDMKNMNADLTIGFGHKLTKEERKKWKVNKTLTASEAKTLFLQDLKVAEDILNKKLKTLSFDSQVDYSQGFIDGTVSLLFNMGAGNMFGNNTRRPSEFWQRLSACRFNAKTGEINKNDLDYTLAQIKKQNVIMNGHKIRRSAEYNIVCQKYGEVDKNLYHLKDSESA